MYPNQFTMPAIVGNSKNGHVSYYNWVHKYKRDPLQWKTETLYVQDKPAGAEKRKNPPPEAERFPTMKERENYQNKKPFKGYD